MDVDRLVAQVVNPEPLADRVWDEEREGSDGSNHDRFHDISLNSERGSGPRLGPTEAPTVGGLDRTPAQLFTAQPTEAEQLTARDGLLRGACSRGDSHSR